MTSEILSYSRDHRDSTAVLNLVPQEQLSHWGKGRKKEDEKKVMEEEEKEKEEKKPSSQFLNGFGDIADQCYHIAHRRETLKGDLIS